MQRSLPSIASVALDHDDTARALRHEVGDRFVRYRPALADHHQVVGHQGHLGEQMAADENGPPGRGEVLEEAA